MTQPHFVATARVDIPDSYSSMTWLVPESVNLPRLPAIFGYRAEVSAEGLGSGLRVLYFCCARTTNVMSQDIGIS